MDGQRFDDLARAIAATVNRRQLLRTLGGAAGAALALAGLGRSGAASCRDAGRMCNGNGDCCSGLCDTANADPFKRNRCACPPGTVNCRGACLAATAGFLSDVDNCGGCGNRCPIDQCNRAVCVQGQCDLEPNPDRVGRSCNDNNLCTTNDVCQADGSCRGTPKDCSALTDQCNVGVCNPANGACVKQPRPNNTPCNDGNPCTQTDTCQGGQCVGGNPVVCTPLSQCHVAGTCNPSTGVCSNPPASNTTPCENPSLCLNGGTCDGQGTCIGGTPTDCSRLTSLCAVGTCDPSTGACIIQPTPGVRCDHPILCFDGGTCTAQGACVGGTPRTCTPQSQCHTAACNPDTGACVQTPLTDAACGGGTCCDGACVDTQTDERNCGFCGNRCGVNETCIVGHCLCGNAGSCSGTGLTCCPHPEGFFCVCEGQGAYLDLANCPALVATCSSGTTPCEGTTSICGSQTRVCCPSGSTCNTANGTCQQ